MSNSDVGATNTPLLQCNANYRIPCKWCIRVLEFSFISVLAAAFLVFTRLPSSAQSFKAQPSAKRSSNNSLLWEIKSPKGAVSHIFGTIHLKDSTVFFQRDTVLLILSKAHSFYAEINLDSALGGGFDPSMMMLPEGETLKDYFSAEQLVVVRKALRERLGPMSAMAERLKPAAIVALLMMDSFEQTTTKSVDEFLWDYAKSSGLLVNGVETLKEQLSIMDKMPASMLFSMITETDNQDSIADVLVGAYANEDLSLVSLLVEEAGSMEGFMATLNDERNVVITQRLVPQLHLGKIFIAVGAAHLPGKRGILQQLRNQGFVVTAVMGGRRVQWTP